MCGANPHPHTFIKLNFDYKEAIKMSMSEQVISVIDVICDKFGIAIDWTSENILPYIQELFQKYIRYEIATSIAWSFVFVFVTALSFLVTSKLHKKTMAFPRRYDEDNVVVVLAIVLWVVTVFLSVISVIVICNQVFDIITCITIPEKMILEYAQRLMRGY